MKVTEQRSDMLVFPCRTASQVLSVRLYRLNSKVVIIIKLVKNRPIKQKPVVVVEIVVRVVVEWVTVN